MFDWLKNGGAPARARPRVVAVAPALETGGHAGEYELLHRYLRDRYADRVVLTFAEIEDLLGFALPAPARGQQDWWSPTTSLEGRATQSDAWTLAGRTACANLVAHSVVFERDAWPG